MAKYRATTEDAKSTKKLALEEVFESWCIERYKHRPQDLTNQVAKSKLFLRWYISAIHNQLESDNVIDEDSIGSFIVDGQGDLGADCIWFNNDSESPVTFIIQAKYFSRNRQEDREGINDLRGVLDRLRNRPQDGNREVRELAEQINWEETINLIYISNKELTKDAASELDLVRTEIESSFPRARVIHLPPTELNIKIRSVIEGIESNTKRISFKYEQLVNFNDSKIVFLTATQVVSIYEQANREKLFSANIRLPLRSDINSEIQQTLIKNPGEFFYLNNGISGIATRVVTDESSKTLDVSGLQIINGAQTVDSIAQAAKVLRAEGKSDVLKAAFVQMRLITRDVAHKTTEDQQDFIERVIEKNNTQNKVNPSDYSSRHPIQKFLKAEFAKLKQNGSDVAYQYRRGESYARGTVVIKKEVFGQRLLSFIDSPIAAGNSIKKLFDTKGSHYVTVFQGGDRKAFVLSSEDFRYRAGIWWLSEFLERLRSDRYEAAGKPGYLSNLHVILFVSRLLLDETFTEEGGTRRLLAHCYEGHWMNNKNSTFHEMFSSLFDCVEGFLNEDYTRQSKEKGNSFKTTDWRRSQQSINRWSDDLKVSAWRKLFAKFSLGELLKTMPR